MFQLSLGIIVSAGEPTQKMLDVPTRRKDAANDPKVADCRGVDVEDRNPPGPPEWNEVETVQTADDTNHMNILAPVRRHTFVVGTEFRKLTKRSVLTTIIGPVENHFRVVMIYRAIEGPGCF